MEKEEIYTSESEVKKSGLFWSTLKSQLFITIIY